MAEFVDRLIPRPWTVENPSGSPHARVQSFTFVRGKHFAVYNPEYKVVAVSRKPTLNCMLVGPNLDHKDWFFVTRPGVQCGEAYTVNTFTVEFPVTELHSDLKTTYFYTTPSEENEILKKFGDSSELFLGSIRAAQRSRPDPERRKLPSRIGRLMNFDIVYVMNPRGDLPCGEEVTSPLGGFVGVPIEVVPAVYHAYRMAQMNTRSSIDYVCKRSGSKMGKCHHTDCIFGTDNRWDSPGLDAYLAPRFIPYGGSQMEERMIIDQCEPSRSRLPILRPVGSAYDGSELMGLVSRVQLGEGFTLIGDEVNGPRSDPPDIDKTVTVDTIDELVWHIDEKGFTIQVVCGVRVEANLANILMRSSDSIRNVHQSFCQCGNG